MRRGRHAPSLLHDVKAPSGLRCICILRGSVGAPAASFAPENDDALSLMNHCLCLGLIERNDEPGNLAHHPQHRISAVRGDSADADIMCLRPRLRTEHDISAAGIPDVICKSADLVQERGRLRLCHELCNVRARSPQCGEPPDPDWNCHVSPPPLPEPESYHPALNSPARRRQISRTRQKNIQCWTILMPGLSGLSSPY